MNLRFVEAFVWVARLGSFTAAADKLCATQAAISARIASLENDFGVRLFERDNRVVRLTPAGEELLTHAEHLLEASGIMWDAITQRSAGQCVAIGAIEGVIHTWLPDFLHRLRAETPNVRVEVHSYTSFDIHAALLRGTLDLALTSEQLTRPGIRNTAICEFPMAWIVANDGANQTDAEQLQQAPILTFLRNSFVYRDVIAILGLSAVARINVVSSIAAMVALARAGFGVATLPLAVVTPAIASGALRALTDVTPLSAIPVVASRHHRTASPLIERAVRLAEESAAAFASTPHEQEN